MNAVPNPIIVPMRIAASNLEIPIRIRSNNIEKPLKVFSDTLSIPVKVSSDTHVVPMNVVASAYNLKIRTSVGIGAGVEYSGEYTVVPDFIGKVLDTNGRIMRDDVNVVPIPVSITTNLQGGNTVYIGGEINYG